MSEDTPTVSILLPVYNGAAFLREQVRSILDQSCRDFELLLHDDASTDGSLELLQGLAASDPRIALTMAHSNAGQKFRLRGLLARARGRFVMFCDQDDVWHPSKIELLLKSMENASLCYGASQLIDERGAGLAKSIADFNGPPIDGRDNTDFLFRSVVSGHALLARREIVDPAIFLFGTEYDWLLAVLATFGKGVKYVPDAITLHRQHAGNQVNAFGARKRRSNAQSKHWHRVMRLHDALSLLRASDQIDDSKRVVFSRLYRALQEDVMLGRRPALFNHRFAAAFASALDELAVAPPQRERAQKAVGKICRGPLHPKSLRDAVR